MPDGKIYVICLNLRQFRLGTFHIGLVAGGQLLEKDAETPAVENDVMDIGRQDEFLGTGLEKLKAVERVQAEIEAVPNFPRQDSPEVFLADFFPRQRKTIEFDNPLKDFSRGRFLEDRAQAGVAPD